MHYTRGMATPYPPNYPQGMYAQPTYFKSTTPRTLGMLSIVFGSLVAAMSALGLIAGKQMGMMMQGSESQKELLARFAEQTHGVSMFQSSVMLVMSLALIYIGVGQRKYMRWATGASVKWGVIALIYLVVNLVIQFTVVMPALDKFMAEMTHGLGSDVPIGGMMKIGQFIGVAMYAAYPIILISSFRKPHNVAAMDQPAMPTATVVNQ